MGKVDGEAIDNRGRVGGRMGVLWLDQMQPEIVQIAGCTPILGGMGGLREETMKAKKRGGRTRGRGGLRHILPLKKQIRGWEPVYRRERVTKGGPNGKEIRKREIHFRGGRQWDAAAIL